ncbi:MAG: DUF2807 domain-containing protein [Spirochaetales bacterium]|nr:DUF2807 domain-containing protein [Spirochaetales bacterium]
MSAAVRRGPATALAALAALAAGLIFAGCSLYPPVVGSGNLAEGTADFRDFAVIQAASGFDVTVIGDVDYGLSVTVDDNVLEHVQLEKQGNTLSIQLDPWHTYQKVTLQAVITMPVLAGAELSGASTLRVVDGADLPPVGAFEADVSGASSLMLPAITADTFDLELSGASTASVGLVASAARFAVSGASRLAANGSAGSIAADLSGASEGDLKSLSGGNGELELSGASRLWVTLSGLVDAEVTGGSTLYYRGGLSWGRLVVSDGSQLKSY